MVVVVLQLPVQTHTHRLGLVTERCHPTKRLASWLQPHRLPAGATSLRIYHVLPASAAATHQFPSPLCHSADFSRAKARPMVLTPCNNCCAGNCNSCDATCREKCSTTSFSRQSYHVCPTHRYQSCHAFSALPPHLAATSWVSAELKNSFKADAVASLNAGTPAPPSAVPFAADAAGPLLVADADDTGRSAPGVCASVRSSAAAAASNSSAAAAASSMLLNCSCRGDRQVGLIAHNEQNVKVQC